MSHNQHPNRGLKPGPPDSRDPAPCPYPMARVAESPNHDWHQIGELLEEMLEDDNIRESTARYLSSFHEQLQARGSLSDKQVEIIGEIEQRRNREGKRGF
jgi:hypothetical protein